MFALSQFDDDILSRSRLCRYVIEWRDRVAPALVFKDPLWNVFGSNAFFGTVDVHELDDPFVDDGDVIVDAKIFISGYI